MRGIEGGPACRRDDRRVGIPPSAGPGLDFRCTVAPCPAVEGGGSLLATSLSPVTFIIPLAVADHCPSLRILEKQWDIPSASGVGVNPSPNQRGSLRHHPPGGGASRGVKIEGAPLPSPPSPLTSCPLRGFPPQGGGPVGHGGEEVLEAHETHAPDVLLRLAPGAPRRVRDTAPGNKVTRGGWPGGAGNSELMKFGKEDMWMTMRKDNVDKKVEFPGGPIEEIKPLKMGVQYMLARRGLKRHSLTGDDPRLLIFRGNGAPHPTWGRPGRGDSERPSGFRIVGIGPEIRVRPARLCPLGAIGGRGPRPTPVRPGTVMNWTAGMPLGYLPAGHSPGPPGGGEGFRPAGSTRRLLTGPRWRVGHDHWIH